jgi:hypothetical protein
MSSSGLTATLVAPLNAVAPKCTLQPLPDDDDVDDDDVDDVDEDDDVEDCATGPMLAPAPPPEPPSSWVTVALQPPIVSASKAPHDSDRGTGHAKKESVFIVALRSRS